MAVLNPVPTPLGEVNRQRGGLQILAGSKEGDAGSKVSAQQYGNKARISKHPTAKQLLDVIFDDNSIPIHGLLMVNRTLVRLLSFSPFLKEFPQFKVAPKSICQENGQNMLLLGRQAWRKKDPNIRKLGVTPDKNAVVTPRESR